MSAGPHKAVYGQTGLPSVMTVSLTGAPAGPARRTRFLPAFITGAGPGGVLIDGATAARVTPLRSKMRSFPPPQNSA